MVACGRRASSSSEVEGISAGDSPPSTQGSRNNFFSPSAGILHGEGGEVEGKKGGGDKRTACGHLGRVPTAELLGGGIEARLLPPATPQL